MIAAGVKTCEGRLWKGDFRAMGAGDVLEFHHGNRSCRVLIVGMSMYDTFEAYLIGEGLDRCLPGIGSVEDGVAVYHQYYSEKEEHLYGVVGIRMELLSI